MGDKRAELIEVLRQGAEAIHAVLEAKGDPSKDSRVIRLLDRANQLRRELGDPVG